ncbi:hypothetical protein SK128_004758 [Halocaridina rubra]|uniref:Uncharacterized protein n=1 Tax=Halocaridina rubra TaxID=373956 RepID=A0AAN8WUA4_HALRR
MTKGIWLTLLIAVVATREAISTKVAGAEDPGGAQSAEGLQVIPSKLDPQNREKFLFGSFSTTTYTNFVLSTSTVFFSCLVGTTSQVVCSGRSRSSGRRMLRDAPLQAGKELTQGDEPVTDYYVPESSFNDVNESSKSDLPENSEKFAFTIWTTSRTTSSITVYYTNTSTTVRLSYVCAAAAVSYPPFNC